MRFNDFIREEEQAISGDNSKIVTVLSLMQRKIEERGLKPEVSTGTVIKFIKNTGIPSFEYEDLLLVNDQFQAMGNIVKNITPQTVTFSTGAENSDDSADNPEDKPISINPELAVPTMAKRAARRRQKPLF
jgi:hypothetical protein